MFNGKRGERRVWKIKCLCKREEKGEFEILMQIWDERRGSNYFFNWIVNYYNIPKLNLQK